MEIDYLKKLAKDPRYIPGIYNYCDRWCERCQFTSRCLNCTLEEEQFGNLQENDELNEVFWQKLSEMLIKSCTVPSDAVLILFGGSGSEIEICKRLKRQYISAEIDEKYYKMIIDRLNKGRIEEKYRLNIKNYEIENIQTPLTLLEEQKEYLVRKEKKTG